MRRRVFNLVAGVSLLFFLATVVLWVRSYWISDRLTISRFRDEQPLTYWTWDDFSTGRGGIGFQRLVQSGGGQQYKDGVRRMMHYWQGDSTVRFGSQSPKYPHFQMGVGDDGRWGFKTGKFTNFYSNGRVNSQGFQLVVPLWSIAILTSVLPTIAVARRKRRPGGCLNCGYSLTGNTSGTCPECGTAIPATATKPQPQRTS